MKNRRIRSLVVLLIAALIVTMMPLTASAASKKPGKVKISSFKVGKVSKETNTTTVTVKWKKVSKATGYQVYEKDYDGNWVYLGKTKKNVTKIKIRKVPAGKYAVKVRAVRKVKGKTYKGKFSKAKSKFITSPLTLEQYANNIEPALKYQDYGGADVDFINNTFILSYDLANDPNLAQYTEEQINTPAITEYLNGQLAENADTYTKAGKDLTNSTGIKGITVAVEYTYKGTRLASGSF